MKLRKFMTLSLGGVLAASVLAGCGVNKDAVVATLDGEEIKLGVANFAVRLQQAQYDDFYTAYFGEDVWSTDLYGSGSTMEESMKENVIEAVKNLYILQNHMSDYGVTLTDDETAAIAEAAETFIAANDDDALDALGATEDIVEEYLTLITIENKMYAAIIADADTEVTDEEANTSAYSYVSVSKTTYTDEDGNGATYTEEEQEQLADMIQLFGKAAAATTLEDAADEYGYTVYSGTFASDTTTLDDDVLAALQGLTEEGEVSDVVETDSYYYVLRLDEVTDEEATEEHRESIISERQSDLYDEVLSGWTDEAEWVLNEKVWATVSFDNLFTTIVESTEDTESADATEAADGTESVE